MCIIVRNRFFFTTTPPSSLFSYAAFLDLPSHLDDTKMAAARHNGIKLFLKLHLHNLNPLHTLFKRIKVRVSIQGDLNMKYEALINSYQKGSGSIKD